LASIFAIALVLPFSRPPAVLAIGAGTEVDVRGVMYEGAWESAPGARARYAWELRKRTSVRTRLRPTAARLDDPTIFETPFLYWTGREAFSPLSDPEVRGLRRFVELGGFLVVDDGSPESDRFVTSVRRELSRAFPTTPLRPLRSDHTVFRSFYLIERPVGRVQGPANLEGLVRGGRLAVAMTRHDLGGALAHDNLGTWLNAVVPGGEPQREEAIRLAVNLAMYALCLDYKDDQVHAPFIMRRRSGGGP
jgi:hypothetical protein